MTTITIRLPDKIAKKLPRESTALKQVLELGLTQLKIKDAIEQYRQGGISLSRAAEIAEISLREMIPLAYAYGLEPKVDERLLSTTLTSEEASCL